ncbi:MAG: DNA-directed RNA polymerase subunit alpha, partial [Patescibacteria group bacterium]
MKHIPLPKKFEIDETVKGKKAKITIEPCYPGYGLTLGNALRRALLSSLPGGAVTGVKIKGVQHEFSTLENVTEDIVDMTLNLKKLRVKVYSDEPVVLTLKAQGEKEVTGADIEATSDAEIINKDCHIAYLNSPEGKLEMELTVAKGVGYVTVEEREEGKQEIGVILVDSIFTPVQNVGLSVEAARLGKKVDYDKIILDIE